MFGLRWRAERALAPLAAPFVSPRRTEFRRLILINNLGRSGGTLLTRLFDGHPEVAVLPYAMRLGAVGRHGTYWPNSPWRNGNAAAVWRDALYDPRWPIYRSKGFVKRWGNGAREAMPLSISAARHYAAFRADPGPLGAFAAYFAAWREWRGTGRETTILLHRADGDYGVARNFFATFPDGTTLTTVREPTSWLASFVRARQNREAPDVLLRRYAAFLEGIVAEISPNANVISFQRLVTNTEVVMRALCQRLSIAYDPCLLVPTFNGTPVAANSSFPQETSDGVAPEAAERGKHLDQALRDAAARYDTLYKRAISRGLIA